MPSRAFAHIVADFVSTLLSLRKLLKLAFMKIYVCELPRSEVGSYFNTWLANTCVSSGTKYCYVWYCVENHQAGQPVLVSNKAFIDFMFVRALEVATQRNIPMQIHTGYLF